VSDWGRGCVELGAWLLDGGVAGGLGHGWGVTAVAEHLPHNTRS
jgi:hypothetical protein